MKSINVVAAVIKRNNQIFAVQRGYGEFKGKWEFPGGKIENGESEEEALNREIIEELDASIKINSFLRNITWDYPSFHLNMDVYLCSLKDEKMELKEAMDSKWLTTDELNNVDWLPADKLLLDQLKELLNE